MAVGGWRKNPWRKRHLVYLETGGGWPPASGCDYNFAPVTQSEKRQ